MVREAIDVGALLRAAGVRCALRGRPVGRCFGASKEPTGEPIKIGLLGLFSGIGGPVHIPKKQAYEAWAEMVNANGGINGHPVEVIARTTTGTRRTAVSIAKDMVENEGVVALADDGIRRGRRRAVRAVRPACR